jgi:hypothetical protein
MSNTATINLARYEELIAIEKGLSLKGSTLVSLKGYSQSFIEIWHTDELIEKITKSHESLDQMLNTESSKNELLRRQLSEQKRLAYSRIEELDKLRSVLYKYRTEELINPIPRPNTTSHNDRYEPKEKTNFFKRLFNL